MDVGSLRDPAIRLELLFEYSPQTLPPSVVICWLRAACHHGPTAARSRHGMPWGCGRRPGCGGRTPSRNT